MANVLVFLGSMGRIRRSYSCPRAVTKSAPISGSGPRNRFAVLTMSLLANSDLGGWRDKSLNYW